MIEGSRLPGGRWRWTDRGEPSRNWALHGRVSAKAVIMRCKRFEPQDETIEDETIEIRQNLDGGDRVWAGRVLIRPRWIIEQVGQQVAAVKKVYGACLAP